MRIYLGTGGEIPERQKKWVRLLDKLMMSFYYISTGEFSCDESWEITKPFLERKK